MKKCLKCFEYKEHFHTANVCIDCYKERKRLYYQKNKELLKEKRKNNPANIESENRKEKRRLKLEQDKLDKADRYREKTDEEIAAVVENRKEKRRIYEKNYRENNKEKSQIYSIQYRELNREKVKQTKKKWKDNNKEYIKEKSKEYYENNKVSIKEKTTQYKKGYLKNNPKAKFKERLRTRILTGFANYSKNGKTKSCAEYGIDFEAIYNKIGPKPEGNYHLDHIIPVSVFDFDIHEHVKLCNSPENLRWVPGEENLEKWNKIYVDLIEADEKLIRICEVIGLDINKYKKGNKND